MSGSSHLIIISWPSKPCPLAAILAQSPRCLMSQYISSFLIEPVIRQARRFSRPNLGGDPSSEAEQVQTPIPDFPDYVDTLAPYNEAVDNSSAVARPEPHLHFGGSLDPTLSAHQGGNRSRHTRNSSNPLLPTLDGGRSRAGTDPQGRNSGAASVGRLAAQFRSLNASFPSSINDAGRIYVRDAGRSGGSASGIQGGAASVRSMNTDGDSMLPEDDGMGMTRKRILEIQQMDISSLEKSRLMHSIMTEQYKSRTLQSPSGVHLRLRSPQSSGDDRPLTPTSSQSPDDPMAFSSPSTSISSGAADVFVGAADLKPTYYVPTTRPRGPNRQGEGRPSQAESEERILGCPHYMRNVKLQCSACLKWYTCRFCHDEVEDHLLIRRETKHMLCMLCGCAQAAAEDCESCGERTAWYYCDVCKLWDNDPKKNIYHCNECGICRIGQGLGKDFFHCKVGATALFRRPF